MTSDPDHATRIYQKKYPNLILDLQGLIMRNIDQNQIMSEVKGLLFNCREVPRGQLLPESLEKLLSGYEPPLAQRHSNLLNIKPMINRQ